MKWKQKNPSLKTVKEVVMNNTGLSEEELLNDNTEYEIRNIDEVISVLDDAIKNDTFVTVIGDYDTDGVTSSSEWDMMLNKKGIRHRIRLPNRHKEGYGLNEKIIDEIDEGIVLTVDNGIAAIPAIKKAKDKGLYVIVVDHHQPPINEKMEVILPEADIIIDPHAIKGQADFNYYCGAGLTYKIALKWFNEKDPILKKLLSLAAIGTVGDVVTLTKDNRKIVKAGLNSILTKEGRSIGLLKLLQNFNIYNRITAEDIGFTISPAINACGRLGAPVAPEGAVHALNLLTFEGSFDKADEMAKHLAGRNNPDGEKSINETRKSLVKSAEKIADKIIKDNAMMYDDPIVINIPKINEGIIGIVAGHLTEKFHVPSIVFTSSTKDPEVLKGSGRSVEGVNLKALLDTCQNDILGYGGHPGAAGLSINVNKIDDLRQHLQEKMPEHEYEDEEYTYDLEITESEIENMIPILDQYGPYGEGNPEPVFLMKNFKLYPKNNSLYSVSGADEEHITFYGQTTKLNAFWLHNKYIEIGKPKYMNVIGTLSKSYYNGTWYYGMKVIDMEAVAEPAKPRTLLAKRFLQRTKDNSTM